MIVLVLVLVGIVLLSIGVMVGVFFGGLFLCCVLC